MKENLKSLDNFTFIVHVPFSLNRHDLQSAQDAVTSIEHAAVEMGLVPYSEVYSRVLLDDEDILEVEVQVRAENIRMLRNGIFDSIHISGSGTSAYVREIIYWTVNSRVDVFFVPSPDSILERYMQLLQR